MQAYSLSLKEEQNDHVFGEFPIQHPGVGGEVGAGGDVLMVDGGSV